MEIFRFFADIFIRLKFNSDSLHPGYFLLMKGSLKSFGITGGRISPVAFLLKYDERPFGKILVFAGQ
jgi:hypothetical protein